MRVGQYGKQKSLQVRCVLLGKGTGRPCVKGTAAVPFLQESMESGNKEELSAVEI